MAIPLGYNLRSIMVRKTTSFATAAGVALVVFVLAAVMMLVNGIEKTMRDGSTPGHAIVLSQGSEFELSSGIEEAAVNVVLAMPEVKKAPSGPLGVGEIVMVALLPKAGTSGFSNVTLRGVTEASLKLRAGWKIVEGTAPKPGTDEVAVGRAVRGRFEGLDLGNKVELTHGRSVNVVGIFEDAGSSTESEVWVDRNYLGAAYGRTGLVSSVRVELTSPSAVDAFAAEVAHDKRLGLDVVSEATYQEHLSSGVTPLVSILGGAVSFFFAIGAMLGAMVTMYTAVANRSREIGTLRALGFARRSILFSFLVESISLTLIGGLIGIAGAMLMQFAKFSILATGTWSEVTFTFEPTAKVIVVALGLAALMGVFGGFLPAMRAARMPPITAMRAR